MNFWQSALPYLVGLYVALGLATWLPQAKDRTRLLALGVHFSIALWSLSLLMTSADVSTAAAANWARLSFVGMALLFPAMGFVVRSLETRRDEHPTNWALAPAVFLSGLLGAGAFHPEVIRGTTADIPLVTFEYGKAYPIELVGLGILGFITFVECARISGRLSDRERVRSEILLAGMAFSGLLTTVPNLLLPMFGYVDSYLYGPYAFLPGALATAYSVAGRKFFDPEVALGPLLNTKRYRLHVRVREAVMSPDAELTLPSVFESLQEAFDSRDFNVAVLDDQGQPTAVVGNTQLPLPSPEIMAYQNGPIVGASEVPSPYREEMRQKRLAAVVRLGSSTKPVGVLSLGESFEGVLFSRQDFALLKMIARQMEMIVKITRLQPFPVRQTAEGVSTSMAVAQSGWVQGSAKRRVLIYDPRAQLAALGGVLRNVGVETEFVADAGRYARQVRSGGFDLAIIHPGESSTVTPDSVILRLRNLNPNLPLLVVTGQAAPAAASSPAAWPEQVLGVHAIESVDSATITRIVETSIAASRYVRGLIDSQLLERFPEARGNLFPFLLASLSEAKDYASLVRLFQTKLIEYHLHRSKSNVEAAKALGLSPPNLSLKLKYFGITYRPFLDPAVTSLKRRDEN
ncbi:MAG: hypothetical protein HYT87_14620 [Nitrospirae bacterium]|nr:hypothetical protein [Nitrospirota bacterium]